MKLKAVASAASLAAAAPSSTAFVSGHAGRRRCVLPPRSAVPNDAQNDGSSKSALLDLLAKVPRNESTPRELTASILTAVKALEEECPTPESDVLAKLAGNWELIWTAQDVSSLPGGRSTNPFATFINPLENQSYSNNPSGRSNPILPQNVQDGLEEIGILRDRTASESTSTQAINLDKGTVRNVVVFEANNPTPLFSKDGRTRGVITVDVRGTPNETDPRRIDVKFDRCRVTLQNSPIDVKIPLGPIGPTGWLRTLYVDDDMRITRGHKGSVFVLSRTASK